MMMYTTPYKYWHSRLVWWTESAQKCGSETANNPQLIFHYVTSVKHKFATKDFTWFPTRIIKKY